MKKSTIMHLGRQWITKFDHWVVLHAPSAWREHLMIILIIQNIYMKISKYPQRQFFFLIFSKVKNLKYPCPIAYFYFFILETKKYFYCYEYCKTLGQQFYILLTLGVKMYFYCVKKFKKTCIPPNNLLITIELEKKTKIPIDKRLKFKSLKGKSIISL